MDCNTAPARDLMLAGPDGTELPESVLKLRTPPKPLWDTHRCTRTQSGLLPCTLTVNARSAREKSNSCVRMLNPIASTSSISVMKLLIPKPWDTHSNKWNQRCTPDLTMERGSQAWTQPYGAGEQQALVPGLHRCHGQHSDRCLMSPIASSAAGVRSWHGCLILMAALDAGPTAVPFPKQTVFRTISDRLTKTSVSVLN